MSATTRQRLIQMLTNLPGATSGNRVDRVKAALTVAALSPDFVIQK